jgi:hypothetical protein
MEFPNSWPLTVQFLVAEQQKLERSPMIAGGLGTTADEIDILCLQYASANGGWPKMTRGDRNLVLQRFAWARRFCASLLTGFRKADGTETGHLAYPEWDFESMMIWFLVEMWRLRESIQKDDIHPLPPRPEPQWPQDPATN